MDQNTDLLSDHSMFCIVCGKMLTPSIQGTDFLPGGGLVFESSGNFGSSIWDPMDSGKKLRVFICDDCILKKQGHIYQLDIKKQHSIEIITHYQPKQKRNLEVQSFKSISEELSDKIENDLREIISQNEERIFKASSSEKEFVASLSKMVHKKLLEYVIKEDIPLVTGVFGFLSLQTNQIQFRVEGIFDQFFILFDLSYTKKQNKDDRPN